MIASSLSLQQLSDLIGLINSAGRDPRQWQKAMNAVTSAIPGVTGHMQGYDTYSKNMPYQLTSNMSEQALKPFIERVPEINIWWDKMGHLPVGQALSTDKHCPLPTIRNSEFYADWLEPNELASCVGCFLFREDNRMAALGFHYNEKHTEVMTPQVMELINLLTPHFKQALQMNREQLTTLTNAENLIERINKPAFILGKNCHIIHMNSAGEHCLKIRRGVTLTKFGALTLTDKAQSQSFKNIVNDTLDKDKVTLSQNSGVLPFTLNEAIEENPNTAFVTPLLNAGHTISNPLASLLGDTPLQTMVTFTFKKDLIQNIAATISQIFPTLTPKEIALITALCQGQNLKKYAAETGITEATLRKQLNKGIFPKTGVNKQNQLVALVMKYNTIGIS